MNINLLKSKMALIGHTQDDLAEMLNRTKQSISLKLKGKNQFKQNEIKLIVKQYNLTAEEIKEIFF